MKRLTADEEGILPLITVKCSAGPLQIVSYPHRTSPSERKRVSNSIGTAILQLRGGSEGEEKQNVIMYRVTHQVVLQVLLTSKGKLYFSIRSTYYLVRPQIANRKWGVSCIGQCSPFSRLFHFLWSICGRTG